MKFIIAPFLTFVFFTVLTVFFINSLDPWNNSKINQEIELYEISSGSEFLEFINDIQKSGVIFDYINIKNFLLILICFFLSLSNFIFIIHIIIDKLFFKKFYENPDYIKALRRCIILPLILVILTILNLIGAFDIFNLFIILFIFGIYLIIEINLSKNNSLIEENNNDEKTI